MKFEYEVMITELQMRLQLAIPPEVREQREKDLKSALKGISDTVVNCAKLLDETMHISTSL